MPGMAEKSQHEDIIEEGENQLPLNFQCRNAGFVSAISKKIATTCAMGQWRRSYRETTGRLLSRAKGKNSHDLGDRRRAARSGRSDTKSEGPFMVAGARFSKYMQIEIEPFPLLA
jgi:hypothetical protein